MKIRKLNQRGFSHFEAIVLIVVLVVIGSVGTFVYSKMHKSHAGSLCKGQTLQVGSTGTCVKDLQTLSVAFTGIKMTIDGKYGPSTKSNILAFQKKAFPSDSTQWDGIAGKNTWSKLCNLIPTSKTQAIYDAQKDACGSASFALSVVTPTPTQFDSGFNAPNGITSDNLGHLWVTNTGNNSLIEINANDGSLVKTYQGASYGLIKPGTITSDNLGHLWVVDEFWHTLTVINANDGSLFKGGESYGSFRHNAITSDNLGHIWVINLDNSLTEINANDGSLVGVYKDQSYGFNITGRITSDNLGHLWVVQFLGQSLIEINANDGSLVKTYPGASYQGFSGSGGITSDNLGHLWVTNTDNNSLIEINANDGGLAGVVI